MFRKVVELTPDNCRGYNNLMGVYFYLGENSRIEEMFEKSVAIKPNAAAYSNLGTIRFFQGRYDDAFKKYEEAIRLGQNDLIIWGNLGDCYRYTPGYEGKAKEAYQQAIKLAEEAKQVNPKDAQLRSRLALYSVLAGETKMALDEIAEARELAPQDVWVLRKCVQVFEFAGRRDMAFNALQDYLTHGGALGLIEGDPDMKELCKDQRFAGLKDKAKVKR
jgi:serine/threonine-protein kinase